ncbi:MAG: lytic transglycosylase domain-containing protein [Clostridia bacterium]|nr:lytic transglycosylase domain-containing protein [Clostridia bacterium]
MEERKKKRKLIRTVLICCLLLALLFSTASGYAKFLIDCAVYPREYREYVEKYSNLYGVEPNLIYAIIKSESKFSPKAISSAGAMGLMQIMPKTYRDDICGKLGLTEDTEALLDPETNIQVGVWYFARWYVYYGTAEEALAAYNAGVGNVNQWRNEGYLDEYGFLDAEKIPFEETKEYVKEVLVYKEHYDELYGSVAESGQKIHENICHEWAVRYGAQYGIDSRLIMAVIRAESTFNPTCLSSSGAKGLMQILKSTYEDDIKMHLNLEESYEDLENGKFNVMCGAYYLHWLSRYLTGNEQILAAYNGGIGNVRRWLKDQKYSRDGKTLIVESIPNEGVRNYVKRVSGYYAEYCTRYRK